MSGNPFLTPAQVAAAVTHAFYLDGYDPDIWQKYNIAWPKGNAIRVEGLLLAVTPQFVHEVRLAVFHALTSGGDGLPVREVIVRPYEGVVIVSVNSLQNSLPAADPPAF